MQKNHDNLLSAIVRQINDCWSQLNVLQTNVSNLRLEIGRLLIQAKEQVPHGEWANWYAENFPGRSMRDGQRCMKMAGADDPEAALAAEQKAAAERMQQHRNKLKSDEHSSHLTQALAQIQDAKPKPSADTWNFGDLPKAPPIGSATTTEPPAAEPPAEATPVTFLPHPIEFDRATTRINRDLAWLARHDRLESWAASVADPAEIIKLLWRLLPLETQRRLLHELAGAKASNPAALAVAAEMAAAYGALRQAAASPAQTA
jgi:Protein of unknown function (DUF3102)